MSTSHCGSNDFLSDLSHPVQLQKVNKPRAKANLVHSPRWDSVDSHPCSLEPLLSHFPHGSRNTMSPCLVEGGPSMQNRVRDRTCMRASTITETLSLLSVEMGNHRFQVDGAPCARSRMCSLSGARYDFLIVYSRHDSSMHAKYFHRREVIRNTNSVISQAKLSKSLKHQPFDRQ